MLNRYFLKLNLLTLLIEWYVILTLLFDLRLPGADYFEENPTTKLSMSCLPLLLTFISKYTEGWSAITIPTVLCSLLIPMAAVIPDPVKLGFAGVAALLALVHARSVNSFPLFELYKPTGTFSVGYKRHEGKDQFKYCVFYPTLHPTKNYPKFLSDAFSWRKYLEIAQGKSKFPPKGVFEVLTHICTKVKLTAAIGSPIISKEELKEHANRKKLIPVIFSHGLGANMHGSASIMCQLASRGCFVVSLDHRDEVKFLIEQGMEQAQKHLEKRVNDVKRIVNEMHDSSGPLHDLLNNLELDMTSLTVMGHSYGGGTSYLSAWEDERIKNIIMLDPWLSPIQQDSLDKKLSCNILLLESDEWSGLHPYFNINERNLQVMEAQRNHTNVAIYCKVPDTQHNHFNDEILVVGGLLRHMSVIKDAWTSTEIYESIIKIIDDFISLAVSKDKLEGSAEMFMKLYDGDKRYPLVKY